MPIFYKTLEDYNLDIKNMVLLLTDAVVYNKCFGNQIQASYPHILHFTCVSHLLHNIAMKILEKFDIVLKIIKGFNTLMGYNTGFITN